MNKVVAAVVFGFSLSFLCTNSLFASTDEFPGRLKFPDVPFIESDELHRKMDTVVVVDARTAYEYQTIRIKGAINMPLTGKTFNADIKNLALSSDKPIIFYCNGHTCYKSYLAVRKGLKLGIKNIFAYDAGVFEWTKTYPDMAVLMGISPVDTSQLITKEKFENHFLSPEAFNKKIVANHNNSMVLDIRDHYQRAGAGFYPGREHWVSLKNQKKLNNYINTAKLKNKILFIYDEEGKQVRWIQYTLENAGIRNYYFMKKGARGYYAALENMQ